MTDAHQSGIWIDGKWFEHGVVKQALSQLETIHLRPCGCSKYFGKEFQEWSYCLLHSGSKDMYEILEHIATLSSWYKDSYQLVQLADSARNLKAKIDGKV